MKLVIVSGLSGAGKTVALKQFEDLGWYCIDNIPLALIEPLLRRALGEKADKRYERMAVASMRAKPPRRFAASRATWPSCARKASMSACCS